jgi:hypothetical protein
MESALKSVRVLATNPISHTICSRPSSSPVGDSKKLRRLSSVGSFDEGSSEVPTTFRHYQEKFKHAELTPDSQVGKRNFSGIAGSAT